MGKGHTLIATLARDLGHEDRIDQVRIQVRDGRVRRRRRRCLPGGDRSAVGGPKSRRHAQQHGQRCSEEKALEHCEGFHKQLTAISRMRGLNAVY
jgi:hypothetical protein